MRDCLLIELLNLCMLFPNMMFNIEHSIRQIERNTNTEEQHMSRSMMMHLGLLGAGLLVLIGLYVLLQSIAPVVLGMVVIVLAHLGVIGSVLYLGRKQISRWIGKLVPDND